MHRFCGGILCAAARHSCCSAGNMHSSCRSALCEQLGRQTCAAGVLQAPLAPCHHLHTSSSGGTFVKGDTLHFDTATDAPVVPAKRKQAATTTRSHATRQASQHLPSSTAHLPTRPAAPAGDSSAAAGSGDVGWKLLQKAGWKPGTGLGKNEHGDTEPIAPRTQLHTHGVGFSKKPPFSQDIGTAGSVPKSSKGDADGKAGDARGKPQLIGPVQGPGRKAVELPPEVKTAAERWAQYPRGLGWVTCGDVSRLEASQQRQNSSSMLSCMWMSTVTATLCHQRAMAICEQQCTTVASSVLFGL